ncbi:MAG: translation elongation factor Ts [Solirubrobacterales bacterium]
MSDYKPGAADVKALRERTGAPMMDTKAALVEAEGDMDKAVEVLRKKGAASADKRSGRGTGEGYIASYTHATGKIGVMVELQCETDFVARNEEFQDFAREVAIHIAAMSPAVLSAEDIPEAEREAEKAIHEHKARDDGKPDEVIEKIVSGQLGKWAKERALLEQEHFNADKHAGKTIEELRTEIAAKTGENVRIARFARFEIGEEA